jgi:hypothetical protein
MLSPYAIEYKHPISHIQVAHAMLKSKGMTTLILESRFE